MEKHQEAGIAKYQWISLTVCVLLLLVSILVMFKVISAGHGFPITIGAFGWFALSLMLSPQFRTDLFGDRFESHNLKKKIMALDKYRDEEDCRVERTKNITGLVAELYDCEGDKVWTVPDSFSDEQIMAALAFANHAFKVGISIGSDRKAEEIRRALGVSAAA